MYDVVMYDVLAEALAAQQTARASASTSSTKRLEVDNVQSKVQFLL